MKIVYHSDGPPFRQALQDMENQIPQVKRSYKEFVMYLEDACKRLEHSFVSPFHGEVLVAGSHSKNLGSVLESINAKTKVLLFEIQERILIPCRTLYVDKIKQADAQKRVWEMACIAYYESLEKYLIKGKHSRHQSLISSAEDKKYCEHIDEKFQSRHGEFETTRKKYAEYLVDVAKNLPGYLDEYTAVLSKLLSEFYDVPLGQVECVNEMVNEVQSNSVVFSGLLHASSPKVILKRGNWHQYWVEIKDGILCEFQFNSDPTVHASPPKLHHRFSLALCTVRSCDTQHEPLHRSSLVDSESSPHNDLLYEELEEILGIDEDKDNQSSVEHSGTASSNADNSPIKVLNSSLMYGGRRRFCFELVSSAGKLRVYQAVSEEIRSAWIAAIQNQISGWIQGRFSQNSELNLESIWSVNGNDHCTDCGASRPEWCSINLGCTLCMECAAVHRSLGTHISQVRSMLLDDVPLESLSLSNDECNKKWCFGGDDTLNIKAERRQRESYIRKKYKAENHL